MARPDRPCSRRAAQPSRSAPAPLYARVSDLEPPTPPRAPFGARPASEPEMRVHRPAALSPAAFRDPEVAALLRLTPSAVKMRLKRGRGMLKLELGEEAHI